MAAAPKPPVIFIAEDDPAVRELLETRLELAGYRTRWAANGRDTYDQCSRVKPDALNRLRQRLDRAQAEAVDGRVPDAAIRAAIADLDQVLETFSALLRIGQLEGGAGRTSFRRVKLGDVVDRVFEAYQPASEESGHILTQLVDSDAEVIGDPELLVQMLSNLVDNALAHAGSGARIQIGAYDEGSKSVLAVRDDGRGVPADQVERITRRFYRLDSSRNTPGQGLGLALVAAITALHEGELVIGPNHPGLAVRVVLPRP